MYLQAPHYKKAAEKLKGLVKVAAIDCDDDKNKPLCGQYGIQGIKRKLKFNFK